MDGLDTQPLQVPSLARDRHRRHDLCHRRAGCDRSPRRWRDGATPQFTAVPIESDRVSALGNSLPEPLSGSVRNGRNLRCAHPLALCRGGNRTIIPVVYQGFNGYDLRLLAFSHAGALMFDQLVTQVDFGDVTGDWGDQAFWCFLARSFCLEETESKPPGLDFGYQAPMPSVGVFGSRNPAVVVADNYQHLIGYNFSPEREFREAFRKHLANDRIEMSSPMLLGDGHSVISAAHLGQGWLLFWRPAHSELDRSRVSRGNHDTSPYRRWAPHCSRAQWYGRGGEFFPPEERGRERQIGSRDDRPHRCLLHSSVCLNRHRVCHARREHPRAGGAIQLAERRLFTACHRAERRRLCRGRG